MEHKELAIAVLEKLSKKVDDAVVTLSDSDHTQLKFFNGRLGSINTWDMQSLNIFAAKDQKLISTSLRDMTDRGVDAVVNKIERFISSMQKNPEYAGIAKGPFKYKSIPGCYDEKIAHKEVDFIDVIKRAIRASSRLGVENSAGVLESSSSQTYILSTENVEGETKGTEVYLSFRAMIDKLATGHRIGVAATAEGIDYENLAAEAATIAKQAQKPQTMDRGEYDIVFDPLPFANLIDHAGSALSAFYVDAGLSWFKDKIGDTVASSVFSLADNGILKGGVGSSPFDEEGVPSQETPLIQKGVLMGYLHNTSTAKKYGTKTTANAGLVSPNPTNLIVSGGKKSHDDLIAEVDNGLYITNTWYTRFNNHTTGDFSTIPRDGIFRIQNGSIKYPLKDLRISDNMNQLLSNIKALGRDSVQIRGWEVRTPILTPSALITDVNISKSTK